MLNDPHQYRYMTVDDMKSLGDDSLKIDVTRDEKIDLGNDSVGKYIILTDLFCNALCFVLVKNNFRISKYLEWKMFSLKCQFTHVANCHTFVVNLLKCKGIKQFLEK